MPTNKQLKQRIRVLEEENQELTEQLDLIAEIVRPDEDEDEDDSGNSRD